MLTPLVRTVTLEIPMGPITGFCSAADESGAQVQLPADVVIELLVLDDVEAAVGQERGDCPDDAGPFRAGQGEDELRRAGLGQGARPGGLGCECRCGTRGTAFKRCGHNFS